MAAQNYFSINRWQLNLIFHSANGNTILYFNQHMAAQYYVSITRWQHNTIFHSPDGSTILYFIHQMAAPFYILISRWQHNIMFQSLDGSTVLYFDHQMAAQCYISITRWQHNIIFQSTDGSIHDAAPAYLSEFCVPLSSSGPFSVTFCSCRRSSHSTYQNCYNRRPGFFRSGSCCLEQSSDGP